MNKSWERRLNKKQEEKGERETNERCSRITVELRRKEMRNERGEEKKKMREAS